MKYHEACAHTAPVGTRVCYLWDHIKKHQISYYVVKSDTILSVVATSERVEQEFDDFCSSYSFTKVNYELSACENSFSRVLG